MFDRTHICGIFPWQKDSPRKIVDDETGFWCAGESGFCARSLVDERASDRYISPSSLRTIQFDTAACLF